jgi:hypothetical protein
VRAGDEARRKKKATPEGVAEPLVTVAWLWSPAKVYLKVSSIFLRAPVIFCCSKETLRRDGTSQNSL